MTFPRSTLILLAILIGVIIFAGFRSYKSGQESDSEYKNRINDLKLQSINIQKQYDSVGCEIKIEMSKLRETRSKIDSLLK